MAMPAMDEYYREFHRDEMARTVRQPFGAERQPPAKDMTIVVDEFLTKNMPRVDSYSDEIYRTFHQPAAKATNSADSCSDDWACFQGYERPESSNEYQEHHWSEFEWGKLSPITHAEANDIALAYGAGSTALFNTGDTSGFLGLMKVGVIDMTVLSGTFMGKPTTAEAVKIVHPDYTGPLVEGGVPALFAIEMTKDSLMPKLQSEAYSHTQAAVKGLKSISSSQAQIVLEFKRFNISGRHYDGGHVFFTLERHPDSGAWQVTEIFQWEQDTLVAIQQGLDLSEFTWLN